MYEAFFQLRQRPFAASPQGDRFFPAHGIDAARQTLARIVDRGEGAGLIIGPSGTGKTLLCLALADTFRDQLAIALLSSGRICTRRALLQAILFELGLPYRGMEEGELRLSLIDHLTPGPDGHPGLLLLVDEAHTLPIRLLEELRMITNLVRDGQPRVRLVLAGGPALEERFASPKLDSFSQRLAARCYLAPMNREETMGYARYQIAAVGGDPDQVFDSAAYESIYRATDGIPRLVNQVCDHAMILSALGECQTVTGATIEEAWGDLQQLPTPWQTGSAQRDSQPGVVEFAPLDELQDETLDGAPAIPFPTSTAPYRPAGPDEQLDQIERQLAEIDEDFQPAGSIGPEIELVFNGSSDPFGEAFDEEEVVIDRYASLEADLFAERPAVSSREGNELSQLLTPWMNRAPEPTLSMNPAGWPAAQSSDKRDLQPQPAAAEDRRSAATGDWAPASVAAAGHTPQAENQVDWIHHAYTHSATAGDSAAAAVPVLPGDAAAFESSLDDADLIVIEDDIPVASSGQPRRHWSAARNTDSSSLGCVADNAHSGTEDPMSRMLTALRVLDRRSRTPPASATVTAAAPEPVFAEPVAPPEIWPKANADLARLEASLENVSALACALAADDLFGEVSPTDASAAARAHATGPVWELPAIDPAPAYCKLARQIVRQSGAAGRGSPLLFAALRSAAMEQFNVVELAGAIVELGGTVLIVDLDRNGPQGATTAGAAAEFGLAEVLSADLAWTDVICSTSRPEISFVGQGKPGLLEERWANQVGNIWRHLPGDWQHVLVSGGTVSRPLTLGLAGVCQATFLLVELGQERTEAVSSALKALRAAGANVRGAIALDGRRPRS